MQLTLLVPELVWPEPNDRNTFDDLTCPSLDVLLARGACTMDPPKSLEAALTDLFGQPAGAPYAAFRLLGETRAPDATDAPAISAETCWLCSDPVHLRFHQESLILADSGGFGIAAGEAQTLIDELNRHFSAIGRFHAASADRWYLRLADPAMVGQIETPPLSAVAGRSIERLLLASAQSNGLRQLLTEAQMLLHAHAVNQQREGQGKLPINSLWLWGAGSIPARIESDYDGVWSTNPLALGLARAAGVPAHPLQTEAATLIGHAAPDTRHLVVLEDLLAAVQYENSEAYRAALCGPNGLETRWFAPLRRALMAGQITGLRLEAPTAYAALRWECRRHDQWKLWRRPQPLGQLARRLAGAAA